MADLSDALTPRLSELVSDILRSPPARAWQGLAEGSSDAAPAAIAKPPNQRVAMGRAVAAVAVTHPDQSPGVIFLLAWRMPDVFHARAPQRDQLLPGVVVWSGAA
jgi:hypothetical protein